ncbi:hypothetical protein PLESTB_001179700 [Pleodorina starrii]|uniref:Peptidase M11 gametolysin domain-containing protein n=1 Tax=Pleodorina starrii TaxID=330485 RepID=A0A9W6BSC9_9CHLO|nr:hypothetical protein PLESTB_001179700 [Pleodorina starrii]
MGRGDACPNAAEIARLGWATPAVDGDNLDGSSLLPGVAKSFVLPATHLTGDNNYLRVLPDWLPTYSQRSLARNIYIAVRAAKGGDAALGAAYASKVNVHEVNAIVDNDPQNYSTCDPRVQLIGALGSLQSLTLDKFKLVLYGGSWVDVDTMQSSTNNAPSAAKPAIAQAAATKAATTNAAQPAVTSQPTTAQSTVSQPATSQTTTSQPTTSQSTVAQPTTSQPATSQTTTSQTTVAQPTTSQPTTSPTTVAQPTTSQTASSQPVATQPNTAQSIE